MGNGKVDQCAGWICSSSGTPCLCLLHLLFCTFLGLSASCAKAQFLILLWSLHEESRVGGKRIIVVTWAVGFVAVSCPHGDGSLVGQTVNVVVAGVGVAHKVPAGIGSFFAWVDFQSCLYVIGRELRIIYRHLQFAAIGSLEDVAPSGMQRGLVGREVLPSALTS